ncbi:uncharacterized protein BDV14DRAFT_25946 [Aspergillus stella-maris]|uniref:uncharacterized protein n=1 Tax=Aspergillus stella-maris TaxID=1810926 RepID=UPI003CCCF160
MSIMNVHGASISATSGGGWYTFTNLGPLTTTYTPAPSCTGSDAIAVGSIYTDSYLFLDWQAQCTNEVHVTDCVPKPTSTASEDSYLPLDGSYYSPGVYCPAGWETIAMAGRDGSSKLTTSGDLAPTTTTTTTSTKTRILITGTPTGLELDDYYDDYYDYYEDYDYEDYEDYEDLYTSIEPVSVLMSALEPSQTLALCCPSGYTTDAYSSCYSSVKDYKPSYGCTVVTDYDREYTEIPYTYTQNIGESYAILVTTSSYTPTATITEVRTYSTTFDSIDKAYYTGYMYAPVITIVHHASDVESAHEAEESAASAKNGTDDSPTNAAGRLSVGDSVWSGLGSVMGIWGAAVVVGAAMVLPW